LDVYSHDNGSGTNGQNSDTTTPQNFFPQDLAASTPRSSSDADPAGQAEATRRRGDSSFLSRRRHDEQQAGHPSAHSDHKNSHQKPAFFNPIHDDSSEDANHTPATRTEKSMHINLTSPAKIDAAKSDDGSETSFRRRGGQSLEGRVARLESEKSRHGGGAKYTHSSSAEPLTPAPPFDPSPPVVPRSIRPRVVPPSQSNKGQAEVGNSAPQIKVTIGRVEVRAVIQTPPVARSPRTHAAPANPSLDDYLKKGERGAR
ncbi:MAG TPA: hypothetical protein VM943_12005, partial [Pyrinomonadaceae bacterium]|nr:hypothetical protein [Pyrinomonadaceae bacterium]